MNDEIKTACYIQKISNEFQAGIHGLVEESQTSTTRSVGSNPTHGVDVSEVEFASEVGDGGEDAVLCAVDVGGRMKNFFYCII